MNFFRQGLKQIVANVEEQARIEFAAAGGNVGGGGAAGGGAAATAATGGATSY
ncbi:unnamed protein product, partial [Rotaria socialis]